MRGGAPSRIVTGAPTGASAASVAAAAPRASSTAPPGGIAIALPSLCASTTGATRSTSGVAAGKGKRTTATLPLSAGALGPYASVSTAAPAEGGRALSAFNGRFGTAPRQVPANPTRRMSRRPSVVIPALARPAFGGLTSCAVPHEDARGLSGREREVVAVHACGSCRRREAALHRGQASRGRRPCRSRARARASSGHRDAVPAGR